MRLSNRVLKGLEITLAVIKPDVVSHPHKLKEIQNIILQNGFFFVRSKILQWSRRDAELFYREHKGRFFYNRLVGFMSSGPMSAHILAREDAIGHWRKLMGPTKTFRAKHTAPSSLRAQFGLTDTRNATHGSDSPEKAAQEIAFFFPEFIISDWYSKEEPFYQRHEVEFLSEDCVHIIKSRQNESVR
ncbi:Nucleoside diphosphate kinase 6 [Holothuria leucospilota]|uniref:Nucleoside diphosphate kinase n=1 Tax=Holothuria leucospilota TaxID=206669 RepID=A0A9Q1BV30_HOLLE|nr:Nucleoside diphosphate kinase 6 [Holothuria leucospilota]